MKKQVVVFTNAYGEVITNSDSKPDPCHENIHKYIAEGWRVVQVQGSGITSQSFNRGGFCFVLEKD